MTTIQNRLKRGNLLHRIRRDENGIAIVEFAIIAPVFLMMLMGIFDMGYALYINSALQGAVQEGARQASLENTLWTDIERKVNSKVRAVVPGSDPATVISFKLDPTYYQNYNDIGLPEDFDDKERAPFTKNNAYDLGEPYTDTNSNGQHDPGEPWTDQDNGVKNGQWDSDECFVDRNGNGEWNSDVGLAGRGGAQDVVSIKATIEYKRIFPLWKFVGQPQTQILEATTFLRNQPFSAQAARVGVRICPAT